MFLIKLTFIFCAFFLIYHLSTKKYVNPYTISLYFGRKGCGKSTILTSLALRALRKGRTVYSTEPIEGCIIIDYQDIGKYHFIPGSLILIDEAGLLFDNRNFKSFPKQMRDFITLIRHYKCEMVMCSQVWDNVDLKIRQQLDYLYIVRKFARVFSVARCVQKRIIIYKGSSVQPSDIREEYSYYMPFLPSSWKIFFIPRWSGYFDSFAAPVLPDKGYLPEPIKSKRLIKYLKKNHFKRFKLSLPFNKTAKIKRHRKVR